MFLANASLGLREVCFVITYFKSVGTKLKKLENCEDGCWVSCVAPTESETKDLVDKFEVNSDFLRAALDAEESSHIDSEDGNELIIIDVPVIRKEEKDITYCTMPLGIIITKNHVITISLTKNMVVEEVASGLVKNISTNSKTQFVFNLVLRTAVKYLQYLKQIDKISDNVENDLRKSMKNKDFMQFLEVEKSLVYFSSSLKANESTLEKIMRGRLIRLHDEDRELLEDVLIEIRQAIEMTTIQINILSSTMEAFASIISNNLNIVMKVLASITLIISVPTVISGFYGMNTELPFADVPWFPWILSFILMIISYFILKKKDMM